MIHNLEFLMTAKEYKGLKKSFNDKKLYSMIRQYDLYGTGEVTVKFTLSVDSELYITILKDKSVINRERYYITCFEKIERIYTIPLTDDDLITINLVEGFDTATFKNILDYNTHIFTKIRIKYEETFYDDLKLFVAYSDLTNEINLISSLYVVASYLINNDYSLVDVMRSRLLKMGFDTKEVVDENGDDIINRLLDIIDNLGGVNSDGVITLLLSMLEIYSLNLSERELNKKYPKLLNLDADSLFLGIKYACLGA